MFISAFISCETEVKPSIIHVIDTVYISRKPDFQTFSLCWRAGYCDGANACMDAHNSGKDVNDHVLLMYLTDSIHFDKLMKSTFK